MGMLLISLLLYVGIPLFLYVFGKWVFVAITILSGDKKLLENCNLCEKDDYNWFKNYDRSGGYNDEWRKRNT